MAQLHENCRRIVMRHLELDAGLTDRELANASLDHCRAKRTTIAMNGFCTMDPDVGGWVQKMFWSGRGA